MDELIAKIEEYIRVINPNPPSDEVLDFVINETIERVQLYLQSETIPTKLQRIIASIVNTGLKRVSNQTGTNVDRAINSISDNGQSISYANEVTKYFSTASDEELFTGFYTLLSRYRRIKVVHPRNNENGNS